ncbi:energy transducer TonB [Dyella tabacisoli]|uniref:Energy transducer TonB n=1 Tax=Dyella tabacisoli TaxID=2282381 RepID=A0A369UPP3_9GAMM|nr:energy transducer TonB [Dyella tabacisoli]RDD82015.1 energy transducer TonB [Dyella tabacisoli]
MNTMSNRIGQSLALVLALACTVPALAQSQPRTLNPQQLQSYWILLNTQVSADIPNSGRNMDKPGCAAVSYTINSDGVPGNIQIAKVVPDSDLGVVAKSVISNFSYGPSLANATKKEPVATYYIVPFNLPSDKGQRQQIIDACKLPGYDKKD